MQRVEPAAVHLVRAVRGSPWDSWPLGRERRGHRDLDLRAVEHDGADRQLVLGAQELDLLLGRGLPAHGPDRVPRGVVVLRALDHQLGSVEDDAVEHQRRLGVFQPSKLDERESFVVGDRRVDHRGAAGGVDRGAGVDHRVVEELVQALVSHRLGQGADVEPTRLPGVLRVGGFPLRLGHVQAPRDGHPGVLAVDVGAGPRTLELCLDGGGSLGGGSLGGHDAHG